MIHSFFPGLIVRIHSKSDVPTVLRGAYARIICEIPQNHELRTTLGIDHLDWIAKTVDRGITIYLNHHCAVAMPYPGMEPAKLTMVQLLRTCHADPSKILGHEGN